MQFETRMKAQNIRIQLHNKSIQLLISEYSKNFSLYHFDNFRMSTLSYSLSVPILNYNFNSLTITNCVCVFMSVL